MIHYPDILMAEWKPADEIQGRWNSGEIKERQP